MAKTLRSQCRGPRFDPWSGNYIPHAATKSLNAATKDPTHGSKNPEHPNIENQSPHFSNDPCFLGFFYKFIYLFLAALGLHCCMQAFSSCGEQGLLFIVVRGLLTLVASLVAEHVL